MELTVPDRGALLTKTNAPKLWLMAEEQRQRGSAATQSGPTGEHVRRNLIRLRKARGLTTYQLAKLLADAGRPIPQSGISRIESGGRRVDVDDLTSLAAVLKVSPSALLLPLVDSPAEMIEITGSRPVDADTAWAWMDGLRPLHLPSGNVDDALLDYVIQSRPPGSRRSTGNPLVKLVWGLYELVRDVVSPSPGTPADETAIRVRLSQRRVESIAVNLNEIATVLESGDGVQELKRKYPGLVSHVVVDKAGKVTDISEPTQDEG